MVSGGGGDSEWGVEAVRLVVVWMMVAAAAGRQMAAWRMMVSVGRAWTGAMLTAEGCR